MLPLSWLPLLTGPVCVGVQCNVGWAGNGHTCGVDTDMDGYPDRSLPCIDNHKHCKQVRVLMSSRRGHVTSRDWL